jgi:hypothetical protein
MSRIADKKVALKDLIKKLHDGADHQVVKEDFKSIAGDITPVEIAQIEEELVNEGLPFDEIHRLCDVHLALFRESLEKETLSWPPGHPVHILMEEHKALLGIADDLMKTTQVLETTRAASADAEIQKLNRIVRNLRESESHYLREENVLFPYVQKHGLTQPTAIMWAEHNKIRAIEKSLFGVIKSRKDISESFVKQNREAATSLTDMLSRHFYKENNVLFPTSIRVIEETEWTEIRKQFDELGYCPFTPATATVTLRQAPAPTAATTVQGRFEFETGSLSSEEIESILDSLPVEVTFIDKDDRLRYFSQSKAMIFVRTKAALGLKVQQCHPQKSLHVVNKILEDFKVGRRNEAKFWINLKDRLVYIQYFPVRNKKGDYLGCVETTQNVSDIKRLEGEKRLLDTM